MTTKESQEFKDWLMREGAELLPPTNPYELVRFRACGGVHVIYQRANGRTTMAGVGLDAYSAFRRGSHFDMGLKRTKRNTPSRYVRQCLLNRDGRECFFCLGAMPDDDITVEHLVPLSKGGPDHQDNMVLAHFKCNNAADNLPLLKKIEIRVKAILGRIPA